MPLNGENRKEDPRIIRTRNAIREAFLELMQEEDYNSISVKDIAERAGINRKTFYAHYETREHLLSCMLKEMFDDLFFCFLYEKEKPGPTLDTELLQGDIVRFFELVEHYRREIDLLITGQTSTLAFQIADETIREGMDRIHITRSAGKEKVPASLLVARIRNFFLTSIDWWLEQDGYTPRDAADVFGKIMRRSMINVFRYQQMQLK